MGLTLLLAALAMAGLVLPAAKPDVFEAGLAAAWGLATLVVLALPLGRRAVADTLSKHWAGAGLFLVYFGYLAGQAMFAPDPALARAQAERDLILLAAMGLGGLAVCAAAVRQGPGDAVQAILGAAAIGGLAVLLAATLGQTPPQAGLGLAGLCILSGFAVLEAMRRAERADAQGLETAPFARRLFLPAAAFLSCATALAALRDGAGAAAAVTGILALAGAYLPRVRRSQRPQILAASAGLAALASGLCLTVVLLSGAGAWPSRESAGEALALWRQSPIWGIGLAGLPNDAAAEHSAPGALQLLAETGVVGAGLAVLGLLAASAMLAATPDRGRRPSRGGGLLVGLGAAALVNACLGPALSQTGQTLAIACLMGQSMAYGDRRAGVVSRPGGALSAGPAGPAAKVGTRHL